MFSQCTLPPSSLRLSGDRNSSRSLVHTGADNTSAQRTLRHGFCISAWWKLVPTTGAIEVWQGLVDQHPGRDIHSELTNHSQQKLSGPPVTVKTPLVRRRGRLTKYDHQKKNWETELSNAFLMPVSKFLPTKSPKWICSPQWR